MVKDFRLLQKGVIAHFLRYHDFKNAIICLNMCFNCGCSNVHDDMGSPDNITLKTLQNLSQQQNQSLNEIELQLFQYLQKKQTDNPQLEELFSKAATAWGQSIDDAKNETYKALNNQLKK